MHDTSVKASSFVRNGNNNCVRLCTVTVQLLLTTKLTVFIQQLQLTDFHFHLNKGTIIGMGRHYTAKHSVIIWYVIFYSFNAILSVCVHLLQFVRQEEFEISHLLPATDFHDAKKQIEGI